MAMTPSHVLRCQCPNCGTHVRASVESAGKRGRCPKCGQSFEIPSASQNGLGELEPALRVHQAHTTVPLAGIWRKSSKRKRVAVLVAGGFLVLALVGIISALSNPPTVSGRTATEPGTKSPSFDPNDVNRTARWVEKLMAEEGGSSWSLLTVLKREVPIRAAVRWKFFGGYMDRHSVYFGKEYNFHSKDLSTVIGTLQIVLKTGSLYFGKDISYDRWQSIKSGDPVTIRAVIDDVDCREGFDSRPIATITLVEPKVVE